jgi:hypothetical protein
MRRRTLTALAIATISVATVAIPVSSAAPAKIASVTFTGGEPNPTVTIRGQGFGRRPKPNPSYHPLGNPPLCPPEPTKPGAAYGFDYGTSLYHEDLSQTPKWTAGRYRPNASELDCVGLIVVRYTPTTVVLRLGAFYREAGFHLAEGDADRVSVNGLAAKSRVHYR